MIASRSTATWFSHRRPVLLALAAMIAVSCAGPNTGDATYGPGASATPDPAATAGMPNESPAPPGACHFPNGDKSLPDPACTPGETDPRVTQATIHQTICVPGWSKKVRPPVTVTEPIKSERMAAYGMRGVSASEVELDHLIAITDGGATTRANLWPEYWVYAHKKDDLEVKIHEMICSGQITLAAGQQALTVNWPASYQKYVGG